MIIMEFLLGKFRIFVDSGDPTVVSGSPKRWDPVA